MFRRRVDAGDPGAGRRVVDRSGDFPGIPAICCSADLPVKTQGLSLDAAWPQEHADVVYTRKT